MRPIDDARIRASFLNASQRERAQLTLPDLDALDWDTLQFLGWRDPKFDNLGYVVLELDGVLAGVILRRFSRAPNSRAQCSWCNDIELPNEVVLFNTKRTGDAGRKGDTVGTLVCANFECNRNARKRPREAYLGFDVEAARQRRIDTMRENVERFVRGIRDGV
ncbi:FBP domain-containing protein [Microbacterium sp.]|uniref:FBP domain-containing protein n=1 Tax=Microbacterium sp. TaxID=51671 RepID=UPI003F717496